MEDFIVPPPQALIKDPRDAYITVNSLDRNRTEWPSSSYFRTSLVNSLYRGHKNIHSIKLLSAVIPKTNNVLDEPYLLLQLDEIDGSYDAVTKPSQLAFTKIYFQPALGKFLRLDKGVGDPLTHIFWPTPKASLDDLTISIRKYNGEVFDFGEDNGPQPNPELQTSFTFEITSWTPDAKQIIGHRNI